jgi:hypothetical protein
LPWAYYGVKVTILSSPYEKDSALVSFASTVEFVVFGRFAGFDVVVGEDWLPFHECFLDMGHGRVIINTEGRKFVLSYIATKNKAGAYNRTPIPTQSCICPSLELVDTLDEDAIPTEISRNDCARLFNFMTLSARP